MLFPKVISLDANTDVYYSEKHGEHRQLLTGFYLIQALIYDTVRTDLIVMANQIGKANVIAVRTDCLYFTHSGTSNIFIPFNKSIGSNFDEIKPIEKATKEELTGNEIYISPSTAYPHCITLTITKDIILQDEFDINSFNVLSDLN
jgi:hypothetical protein